MASFSRTLYIGVTNDLLRRVHEHESGTVQGFTQKYHINRLVYYEYFTEIQQAIRREKELKKWRREKKITLIESKNPDWKELPLTISEDFSSAEASSK